MEYLDATLRGFGAVIANVDTPLAAIALFSLILFVVGYSFFRQSHISARLIVFFALITLVVGAVLILKPSFDSESQDPVELPIQSTLDTMNENKANAQALKDAEEKAYAQALKDAADKAYAQALKDAEEKAKAKALNDQELFPSGYGIQVCGCHGYNPQFQIPDNRCKSGYVRINQCQTPCTGGGFAYAYVCL